MYTATRALTRAKQTGTPLPELEALHDLHHGYFQFRFRGGQQTMIAGQPASQKSGFAIYLAAQWAHQHGVSVLYVSADMDQHTAATRLVASVTGHTTSSVSAALETGNESAYSEEMDRLPVRFVFNPNPTVDDIWLELDAWVELWDEWPRVVVLDNLLDIIPPGGENETTGYKAILLDGKTVARKTGASVITLHHMSEAGSDPAYPAPRKLVMGKVSQTAENVLSVALGEDQRQFRVGVVKQRNGPCEPTGQRFETLHVEPQRNLFERLLPMSAPRTVWEATD